MVLLSEVRVDVSAQQSGAVQFFLFIFGFYLEAGKSGLIEDFPWLSKLACIDQAEASSRVKRIGVIGTNK